MDGNTGLTQNKNLYKSILKAKGFPENQKSVPISYFSDMKSMNNFQIPTSNNEKSDLRNYTDNLMENSDNPSHVSKEYYTQRLSPRTGNLNTLGSSRN